MSLVQFVGAFFCSFCAAYLTFCFSSSSVMELHVRLKNSSPSPRVTNTVSCPFYVLHAV